MADVRIRPGRLHGSVTPPPAKSDAHRALIAASLCNSRHLITGLPDPLSDDLQATQRCLDALLSGGSQLDCGESGTTLRLLIPLVGALPPGRRAETITFTGHGRLPYRPLGEYKDILGPAGLDLVFGQAAFLPLRISGRLQPGIFRVPGHISSQYLSGLLLALPFLQAPSEIVLTTPLESAPYVAMTLRTLARYGIRVGQTDEGYHVPAPQNLQPAGYHIEKDYSQAAFWLTAAYGGCDLAVDGLPDLTEQGDRAIVDLLGALAQKAPETVIDAAQIPDLVPILAVAAALTPTQTRIIRAGRLRHKESDRLETTQKALWSIGADIEATADSLIINGSDFSRRIDGLTGGPVDSCGDHRIAMALSIAALFTHEGIVLRNAEAVRKSYPNFFYEFNRLGGDLHELDLGTEPEHQLVW